MDLVLDSRMASDMDLRDSDVDLKIADSDSDLVVSGLATSLGISHVIVLAVVIVVKCPR